MAASPTKKLSPQERTVMALSIHCHEEGTVGGRPCWEVAEGSFPPALPRALPAGGQCDACSGGGPGMAKASFDGLGESYSLSRPRIISSLTS